MFGLKRVAGFSEVRKATNKFMLGVHLSLASGGFGASTMPVKNEIIAVSNNVGAKKLVGWENAADNLADINKAMLVKRMAQVHVKMQKAVVLRIMKEDKNCFAALDKEKMAQRIVKIAKEYDADPVEIASIVKKETHFTPGLNDGNAKGLMQLTEVSIKDMYQRPELYNKKLGYIIKRYPSHKHLFNAIQQNQELNLRVGTIAFQYHKTKARGNVKYALQGYNGSPQKVSYSDTVLKDIKKYKKLLS